MRDCMASAARILDPEALPAETRARARAYATTVFAALGCEGIARIDFLIDGGGGAGLRAIDHPKEHSVFAKSEHAFLDVTVDEHTFTARFLDTDLKPAEDPILARTK